MGIDNNNTSQLCLQTNPGYSEEFQLDVIRSGIESFERICQVSDEGGTPLFDLGSIRVMRGGERN